MKAHYILNFTFFDTNFIERKLENKMVEQIQTMFIEHSYGFSFIENQLK